MKKNTKEHSDIWSDLESLHLLTKKLTASQFLINYLQSKGYQVNLDNIKDGTKRNEPYYMKDEELLKDITKFYLG